MFEVKSEWQLPLLPLLPSVIKETPPPSLKLNLNGNYPPYPNYLRFLERPALTMVLFYAHSIKFGYRSPLYQFFLACLKLKNGDFELTALSAPQPSCFFRVKNLKQYCKLSLHLSQWK